LFSYSFGRIEEEKKRERAGSCMPILMLELFNFPVRFHDEATTSDTGSNIGPVDNASPGANEFDDNADEEDHDDKEACRQESSGGERDGSTDSGVARTDGEPAGAD
jgi:hypothetical protein